MCSIGAGGVLLSMRGSAVWRWMCSLVWMRVMCASVHHRGGGKVITVSDLSIGTRLSEVVVVFGVVVNIAVACGQPSVVADPDLQNPMKVCVDVFLSGIGEDASPVRVGGHVLHQFVGCGE